MNIRILGSPEVIAVFALGGVEGRAVATRQELHAGLDEAMADADLRVLVVEEGCAELAREEIDQLKLTPHGPVVVEIAGIEGPLSGRSTPLDLVRRALGISL